MGFHITEAKRQELGLSPVEIRDLSVKRNNAKHRCYKSTNPNHKKHYQEKGITVCDEWLNSRISFIEWAIESGYEYGLELDRIDNTKGYTPENCRFVDIYEGRRNRTTCRSFDEKNACRILREHGFSEVFISEHFPSLQPTK